jgi:hypothetical protein
MPKAAGATCQFIDECEDGYECDRDGSKKYEKLCNTRGRSPRCPAGQVCTKVFPSCEAGLCKPL